MQCHLFMSWKKVLLGGFFPKRDTQLCYPPTVLPSPSSVGGSRANYSYNRVTVSQNAAGNSETATISDHNRHPVNTVSHNIICYSPLFVCDRSLKKKSRSVRSVYRSSICGRMRNDSAGGIWNASREDYRTNCLRQADHFLSDHSVLWCNSTSKF